MILLRLLREGAFHCLESLDVASISNNSVQYTETFLPLRRPLCTGRVRKLDPVYPCTFVLPLRGTFHSSECKAGNLSARISCARGEGALLNVESGWAIYRRCDQATKVRLCKHMKASYRSWLYDKDYAEFLTAHDLFLVTGTYMTDNWEEATFENSSTSLSGEVSVDATLASGSFKIDWQTCTPESTEIRTGHVHLDQVLLDHNVLPSFGACCPCTEA